MALMLSKNSDLSKQLLYEGVKTLLDCPHHLIHLYQSKLYTLFPLAFNYLLYRSQKEPGCYILRFEDSALAEKLSKKSKDETTRKFLQKLLLPRRLKYGESTFYMDFFHIGTWAMTAELNREKIKAALVVKNTFKSPLQIQYKNIEANDALDDVLKNFPTDYYLTSLTDFLNDIVVLAFEEDYASFCKLAIPFIQENEEDDLYF